MPVLSPFKCTCELFTIDGFTTSSVMLSKITSLKHKIRNDTVES